MFQAYVWPKKDISLFPNDYKDEWRTWRKDGSLQSMRTRSSLKIWYSNGQIKYSNIYLDLGASTIRAWTPNGNLISEGLMIDTTRYSGRFLDYPVSFENHKIDDVGELAVEENGFGVLYFEKGLLAGYQFYNLQGSLVSSRPARGIGIQKLFYKNGKIAIEVGWNAKKEMRIGLFKAWDKNGKQIAEGYYKDGKPWNGEFREYILDKMELSTANYFLYGKVVSNNAYYRAWDNNPELPWPPDWPNPNKMPIIPKNSSDK